MDAFDFVQKSELKSTPTYANHPDIALAVIESAEYKQGAFGKTPDAEMFDAYRYNDDNRFINFRRIAEWFELDKTKNQTCFILPIEKY